MTRQLISKHPDVVVPRTLLPRAVMFVEEMLAMPPIVRAKDPYGECLCATASDYEAASWVETFSEGLLWCSYNSEQVLQMLLAGELNKLANRPDGIIRPQFFYAFSGIDHVGDYEAILMQEIRAAGGWPIEYGVVAHFNELFEVVEEQVAA